MANITKEKKVTIVAGLTERLKKANSVVFADYSGLTVSEVTELRDQLKEKGADYQVAKHTLLKRAFEDAGQKLDFEPYDNHPLAIAMGYEDEVMVARELHNFARGHDKLEVLGGIITGEELDAAGIKQLAMLPSREELIAKALSSMNAPVSNFAGVLRAVLSSTVYVLDAIKESKS